MQLQEIEDLELEVCLEHLNESFSYTKYKYKYLNYFNLVYKLQIHPGS